MWSKHSVNPCWGEILPVYPPPTPPKMGGKKRIPPPQGEEKNSSPSRGRSSFLPLEGEEFFSPLPFWEGPGEGIREGSPSNTGSQNASEHNTLGRVRPS